METEQELVSFHCLLLGCGGLMSLFSVKRALINIFLINLNCSGVVGKGAKKLGSGRELLKVSNSCNCPESSCGSVHIFTK